MGAVSVHLVCGVAGTLLTGVFGSKALGMANEGLINGGGFSQLWIQVQGVATVGAFVSVTCYALWRAVDLALGLRVSEEDERVGLDLSEMGMEAYPQSRDT